MDYKKLVIYVSLAIVFVLMVFDLFHGVSERMNAKNPDPNHTHADFAVWVNGRQLDFSDVRYISGSSTDESTHPHAGPRQYLHLHDGNGHVIHRHKPGLTLADFFASIGLTFTDSCLTIDDFQYAALDKAWVHDFAVSKRLCNNGKFHWTMIVNGKEIPLQASYEFVDGDKILLSYGASDTAASDEYKKITDDACRYSKTCPWRGDPPTENCIADPMVPCVGT